MDIFDRIAKAAEDEFDGQASGAAARVIDNPGDGRRVGTKRWQPSKTVKRRMEQLEKAREEAPPEVRQPAARSLRTNIEEIVAPEAPPVAKATAKSTARKAKPAPEPDAGFDEEDDSGLSVVPGARGRRRDRARKSRLDEDFENVFAEDDTPSIQNLRRKMRDRPAQDDAVADAEAKGGMLGGILGKKSRKKVDPVVFEGEEDEDDELSSKVSFAGSPLLYVLIAGAAAAGFFVWKTYLA